MSLPIELIDHILDDILVVDPANSESKTQAVTNQRKALAKCLPLSHSFRNRSIRHLFRVVKISGELSRMQQRASLLAEILTGESRLANSSLLPIASVIEEFELSFANVGHRSAGDFASALQGGKPAENFVMLLRLIRFELDEGAGPKKITLHLERQLWPNIAPSFTGQMLGLVRSPHLTHLVLKSALSVPASLLHGSYITGLCLDDVRFQVIETASRSSGLEEIEPPRLTEFVGSDGGSGFFSSGFHEVICKKLFSELKILRWTLTGLAPREELKLILQSSAKSLEELDLGISNILGNFKLKTLRQLTLRVECYSSTIANLTSFFTTPSPMSALHAVHVIFTGGGGDGALQNSQLPLLRSSQQLDRQLSNSSYLALKKVTISVEITQRGFGMARAVEPVRSAAENKLRELFPMLSTSRTKEFVPIVNILHKSGYIM